MNLLAPAAGKEFVAIGRVVRAGRTVTVVSGELVSVDDGAEKVVAILQGTMMAVRRRTRRGLSD